MEPDIAGTVCAELGVGVDVVELPNEGLGLDEALLEQVNTM